VAFFIPEGDRIVNTPRSIVCVLAIIPAALAGCQEKPVPAGTSASITNTDAKEPPMPADRAHVLGYRMNLIDGSPKDLADYQGKVVLIVNVASACGLTPQYQDLEALYKAKKNAGLIVLGFPANNFGSQEPGTNQEIAGFCSSTYGVTFPMFEKISVTGPDAHPLYKQLSGQPAPIGGEPKWNFNKFIIDRSGRVVARFEPKVKPNDPELLAKVEELLRS
jgi:glutathione peroxidase